MSASAFTGSRNPLAREGLTPQSCLGEQMGASLVTCSLPPKHPVGGGSLESNRSQPFDLQAPGLQAAEKGTVWGFCGGRVSDDPGWSSACCRPQAGSSIPWKRPAPPSSLTRDANKGQQDVEAVVHLNTVQGLGRVLLLRFKGPSGKALGHWKQHLQYLSSPALPCPPCLTKTLMPTNFFRDPSGNYLLVSPSPGPGNDGMVERALT